MLILLHEIFSWETYLLFFGILRLHKLQTGIFRLVKKGEKSSTND